MRLATQWESHGMLLNSVKCYGGGEGGIRTHERAHAPYAISSRACSATPAPLRDQGLGFGPGDK